MQNISKKLLFGLGTCFLLYFANSSTTYASTLNCATATNINIPVSECQALLALYDSTNGASWGDSTNRDTDTDVSTWFGITVAGGNVTEIQLQGNNLDGTLPASLSGLLFIELFNLGGNLINGNLPSSRSTWTNINYFNVAGNFMTGAFPSTRSTWTNITYFNVSGNEFTGPLQSTRSTWTNITFFYVSSNSINGSLPSARSTWTNIIGFFALNNEISGPLPSSRSTWTNIVAFAVGNNQITGPLPSTRSTWTSIDTFYIVENQITGPFPSSRSAWTSISSFSANNNQIDGTLPSSRSAWSPTISSFNVTFNLLTGPLPSSWYPARPDQGSVYIEFNDNCMESTGYSVGMQSWLDINAIYTPQNNNCTPPPSSVCVGTGNSCTDGLIINVTLLAGDVCIGSNGTFNFGSYMVSSSLQTVTGAFVGAGGYFFVDDLRGADSGYYTTVQMSGHLVGPNSAVISGVNVRMSTTAQGSAGITLLAGTANSLVEIHAGMASYQSLDLARNLIQRDTAANFGTIGKYGVLPRMELDIPAYQAVGTYTGTLVYTLYLN